MKQRYLRPEIEEFAFAAERGFADSDSQLPNFNEDEDDIIIGG